MNKREIELKTATRLAAPFGTYLISSAGSDGKPNILTVCAVTITCITPPMLGAAITRSHYSDSLIREGKEFVLNVPDAALVSAVDICGSLSGKDTDKFKAAGLTPIESTVVKPPAIAECPVNLECRVERTIELGSHDWFIGEIVAGHIREDLVSGLGKMNAHLLDPILTVYGEYWRLGEKLGEHGCSQNRA